MQSISWSLQYPTHQPKRTKLRPQKSTTAQENQGATCSKLMLLNPLSTLPPRSSSHSSLTRTKACSRFAFWIHLLLASATIQGLVEYLIYQNVADKHILPMKAQQQTLQFIPLTCFPPNMTNQNPEEAVLWRLDLNIGSKWWEVQGVDSWMLWSPMQMSSIRQHTCEHWLITTHGCSCFQRTVFVQTGASKH